MRDGPRRMPLDKEVNAMPKTREPRKEAKKPAQKTMKEKRQAKGAKKGRMK